MAQLLFHDDPKGLKLPSGVPRMVDTNGNVTWLDSSFTTPQYQQAAGNMILEEANHVAQDLQLRGEYPITKSNCLITVTPFGFNYVNKTLGNVTTPNYAYYFSKGSKFCYLDYIHQEEYCFELSKSYAWLTSQINTNDAYELAIEWLKSVKMDVKAINRDCSITVKVSSLYGQLPGDKFVPVYEVRWTRKGFENASDLPSVIQGDAASVLVAVPTKKLLQLRVEDPQYILRRTLDLPNLNSLFPGKGSVSVEPPPKRIVGEPGLL